MKKAGFTPYIVSLLSKASASHLRGKEVMICILEPEELGIAAVDRLYPLKPKNPI